VSDYQGLIKVGVQGLGEIRQLNAALEKANELYANLESAQLNVGQIAQSATRNVNRAAGDVGQGIRDLRGATRWQASAAQPRDPSGRYIKGGGTLEQRRLANQAYEGARDRAIAAKRRLREEEQNRRLIAAAEDRYARALNRASNIRENIQRRGIDAATQVASVSAGIGNASRGNYLTNLYQGRQREFARGGGGAGLSQELQQQARNVRGAWDLATAGGKENLQLMQRIATEMAGLLRQQNELNRGRTGRSTGFETGRRGQERITALSAMPGADPARIRRLRSQATDVISASNTGDIAGSREATLRMNASIGRYTRELNAAAASLRAAMSRGGPSLPIRGGAQMAGSPAYMDRLARLGGPRESIRGRKNLEGSPAYIEEQSRQLQRAISAGGPKESLKGRKDVVGSPAYYEEQQRQLSRAIAAGGPRENLRGRKDIPGSPAFLAEQRRQQAQQLQRAISAGGPRESIVGRKNLPGSPAYLEEQQRKRNRIAGMRQIASPIRGTAAMVGSPAYLEDQQRRLSRAVRMGGPKEGISGRKDLVGSPAYYEEQQRQLQRAINKGGPRESVKGRKDLPGSPAYVEAQRKEADRVARLQARDNERALQEQRAERNRIARLRQISSPIRGTATMVGSPAYLDAQARAQRSGRSAGRLGPASPIGGTKTMVGSPAYLAEQKRQQDRKAFFQGNARKAIGDALIGGAFPALFGQGIGASAGGAAGGFVGGLAGGSFGFGLSLAGTAVGQAVDTTAKNLTELADAIRSPGKALDALEKSGLASSKGLEQTRLYVDQLTAVGRSYDAQTLVLQEVQKRLGPGSLTELGKLDTAEQKVQEQFGAIASEIQVRLLPVLQGFVEFLGNAAGDIGGFASQSRIQRLDPKTFERLRSQAIRETSGPLGIFGNKGKYDARLNELSKQELAKRFANERAKVPQTPQEKLAGEMAQVQESRKLADQIQSAYREAFSLQREAYDLQRNGAILNRDIADYVYKKEREVFDLRQQAAEQQIQNNRGRAQNRIESSDLNARQTFAAAVGFEQQLLGNVREAVRSRKEGEADIEQSRNRLELAMARLNRDTEDYKRTNAREIEDIEQRKLSYVRSVEDYKMKVADYVRDRSREAADLMRQAMTLPDMSASASGGGGSSIGGSKLSQLIGGAESYGGNYGAFNRGGTNNGHYSIDPGKDPNLVNMTIAEIQRRQLAPGVPRSQQLHAVGKYQIIGDTMQSLMRGRYGPTGVSPSDRFTPDVQEKLGSALARNRVMGKTVDEGMRGLRQEWIGLQNVSDAKLRDAVIELQKTGNLQGQTATQISNIPGPKFSPTPIGPTPSIAPMNAANMAARLQLAGGEKEAQRILEEQNKLKQKGIELGQIEQILQGNQLPQLKQQEDTLKQQITARQKILDLSDNAASVADIEAESRARLKQIDIDRNSALAKAKKQYGNDPATIKQINEQANLAIGIAKKEEEQRRKNLDLNNKLQNQEQSRSAILQLQETLATGKAEATALERGELKATNVELLIASELYKRATDDERARLALLTAQTEELGKQNDFRRQINEVRNDARYTGAGLRAGMVGAPARAYEQGLKTFEGDTGKAMAFANENKLLEDQQMIWNNLEKNIVDVSNAISGALTNGLVDIVDGSRKIQDVGRDMLKSIAGTFADSAQQQLTTLMQRQLGGMLGGSSGPLVKMLGAGAGASGPEALGSASLMASGQVAMFGAALQALTGQMAVQGFLSGSTGGLGSMISGGGATGGLGAALSGSLGNIGAGFSFPTFGGFLAGGGTTESGKGYVVGEKGPEFFFPGVSGRVVPNNAKEKASALRRENAKADPIELRYTVTEQRGERYVTEEQFRKGMSSSTKRAQAMTYAGIRNNNEIRDFVGIDQ